MHDTDLKSSSYIDDAVVVAWSGNEMCRSADALWTTVIGGSISKYVKSFPEKNPLVSDVTSVWIFWVRVEPFPLFNSTVHFDRQGVWVAWYRWWKPVPQQKKVGSELDWGKLPKTTTRKPSICAVFIWPSLLYNYLKILLVLGPKWQLAHLEIFLVFFLGFLKK